MKRWRQTLICPSCGSKTVLKARETQTRIKFNIDPSRLGCWNCRRDMRYMVKKYPFGMEEFE